jgi:hypothetical protein
VEERSFPDDDRAEQALQQQTNDYWKSPVFAGS